MAKILTEEALKALKKFDLPKGYQRTGEFPLDPSSVFASKADADLYAAGGADSRGLSGTRYAGQLIAVVEDGATKLYTVEANDTLKAVGGDLSADLADLTGKVTAILNGESIDSFKDVEDAIAALPKDMVVSGGEVRVATEEDKAKDSKVVVGEEYIILTIKNSEDVLYIPAKALVDVYTSGDEYIGVADHKITANISVIETKFVADGFAKKSDITDITDTLATKDELNTVSRVASGAAEKAAANEGRIGTLENTINDPESGLSKEVADIKVTVTENAANIEGAVARITAVEKTAEGNATEITNVKKSVSDLSAKIDAIDIPVKGVDVTASNGVQLGLSDEGNVTVTVTTADLASAIQSDLDIKATEVKLNGAVGDYADASTVQAVLSGIDARVKANTKSIEAAVAGGVTAISEGDGISVDAKVSTQPVVSVKVDADSNIKIDDNKALTLMWIEA